MASNFLKNKAEEQAKKIDKEFGSGTYGSTSDLKQKVEKAKEERSSTNSGGASTNATQRTTTQGTRYGLVGFGPFENILQTSNQPSNNVRNKKSTGEKVLDSVGYYSEKLATGALDGLESVTDFAWSIIHSLGWGISSVGGLWENPVSDKFESWYNDINQHDISDMWSSTAETRYDAAPEWVKNSGWLPEAAGGMLPFIAETYLTGGSTVADDALYGAKSLWDSGKKLLTNPDVHFGMSAAGEATESAVEKGANPITATTYGTAVGALEVATEKLFGGYAGTGIGKTATTATKATSGTTKSLLNRIWDNPVTKKVLDIGAEGLEEAIVTLGDPGLQRVTGVDTNAEWASWSDYYESGTHGIILSVVMNAVGLPISKYGKSKVISSLNESSEYLNGFMQEDAPKFAPLPSNATEEAIAARRKEITAVALAFDNAVRQAVENEAQTLKQVNEVPDSLEQAAMDVVNERNATRTVENTPNDEYSEWLPNAEEQGRSWKYGDAVKINTTETAETELKTENTPVSNRASTPTYEALEALSRNNEPLSVEDVKSVTKFGDSGSVLVAKLVNENGVPFNQAKRTVENAYRAGLTGLDSRQVNLTTDTQKLAFQAGVADRQVQNLAKQEKAKTASVYATGFTENEHSARLTADEREMFSSISKDLKMDTEFADKLIAFYVNGKPQEANASHSDGKMRVSSTSNLPMVSTAVHETFHRMRQLDPQGTDALMNFLYESSEQNARRLKLGDKGVSLFDQIKEEYANVKGMSTIDYIEEVAARGSETIFKSPEAFNKWRAELETNPQAKSAWQKFLKIIKEVLEDMWAAITNSKMSLEAKRQAQKEIELFSDAYRAAMKAADARATEVQAKKTTETQNKSVTSENNSTYKETPVSKKTAPRAKIEGVKAGDVFVANEKGTKYKIVSRDDTHTTVEISSEEGTKTMEVANEIADRNFINMSDEGVIEWIDEDMHIDNRSWEDVGNRKVKAFQFLFPEFKEYYTPLAQELLGDLDSTIKGEKILVGTYETGQEWTGVNRLTSDAIARIKDATNATYDDIRNALNRLINDEGQENVALAKKIELVFDEMLTDGYKAFDGTRIPANEEYIAKKEELLGKTYEGNNTEDALNWLDDMNFSLKNKNLTIDSRIPFTVLKNYINVGGKDISSLNKLEKEVRNLNRETYQNDATGYRAKITGDTIGKAIKPTTNKKFSPFTIEHIRNLNAIRMLPELFKNAVYVDTKPPQKAKNKNTAIKGFHHFVAPLYMNNREFRALITAREKANSNTLYVLKVEVLPTKKGHTLLATQQNAGGSQLLSVPSDISIPELVSGVKIYNYDTNTEDTYTSNDIQFSLKDSDGNALTEAQQEYFKDSKVRDENGNLLVMYQGASEDFTVFDRKKSSYANLYGRGFYFTKSENHASQYGKTRAYYLDIKHPVSTTETTITKSQLRKFLQAVIENEDYSFENYGYGATVDSVLQSTYGKSDFLMLNDVSQTAIGDLVEAVELFNEINGTDYDGIMLNTETVTFNSEQAKLTSNENPTNHPDTRFSLKDSDYLKAVESGDMNTAQRMVDEVAKANGYLISAYHGTPNKDFSIFDKNRVGKGTDQYGAGFYFASNKDAARAYGERVINSRLSIKKPIKLNGSSNEGVNLIDGGYDYLLTEEQAYEVIKRLPNIYDSEESILGDYYDSYWDNGAEDWMIEDLASSEFNRNIGHLDSDLFRNYPNELHEAIRDVVGYDGIEVAFDNGDKFYVAWFDNQMKSSEPVTYNDKGDVIPLSERFSEQNNDIRYSLKDSEGKTLTAEQQEFFKDSKIRDKDGNLLVMYHGTTRGGFTVFGGKKDYWYFTNDKKYAYTFEGRKKNGQFYPFTKERMEKGQATPQRYKVYLNVTNPYIADIDTVEDALYWDKSLAGLLREKGYDALMVEDMSQVVVLNANQIKNTTNKNPSANPDINFSLKGGVDVSPKRTTEYLNAVEDVQKGKKGASERLAKYVDSGMIRTEAYEELINKYGAIPSGEKPHRDVQVPQKTAKDKKVSQTVRTILEAKATPDEALPTIEKMVEDGVFSYDVYTDKQAIDDADSYIKEYGWDESLDDWLDDVEKGVVSKQHTAMGWALYNNSVNLAATTTSETERTTAIKTSLKLLDAMVRHQRSAAQALQATRILKKLSPETQLYGVQKSVSAFQKELTDRYGDKAPDLKIDEDLAEQFINAKTPEERAEIEKEIYKDIGRQMPSRFIDKWNAWRYLAMLGNLRTHVRNVVGNAGFAPVVVAKDMTASVIESIVNRVSTKKMVRGKSIITGNKADRALLKAAWGDYSNVADMISNGGKYNDSAMANQQIEDGRRIFKTKPLEWARKKNSALLEVEDMWFAQPHYAYALAQYCKANNITAEQIQRGKAIAPAREYAIKEAQKATYRDTNAFSQMVSEWGRNGGDKKNPAKKVLNTVIEGILPFRKTPANILVRGVEYSPLGLLKGLSYDLYQVGKGKMTASEAIDNISAGLTGTGLLALGVYLAAQGLIRGHGEDDEDEKEFKELMGHQSYALELPNGTSITLDWLAPEALPFFVGVNIWETTKGSDEETSFSTILNAISNISEPMLEMSCLQSLNDLFEGIGYASSNNTSGLVSILSSAVTSYLTQGLPTLFGQAERTSEENRMSTYTEKNAFLTGDIQYTLGKASAKIPFWDYNQIPYIDAWGRKEASGTALKRGLNNFLNPSYTSNIEISEMEKELLRLYEQTGEGGVFPSRADKSFTVDGDDKYLTADEYVRYATLKGEKSYKLVSDLVNSKAYAKLSDEEKVKAIKEIYDYSNQKAKQAISNYEPESWVGKADEFGSNIGNYISFKTEVNSTTQENDGKISKQEVVDIVLDMAQNDSEMWKMYLSKYDSQGDRYAYDEGVSGEAYMNFLLALEEYDEPNKNGKLGTYTQEEETRAIKSIKGLSQKEKRALWQSANLTSKKNPF